MRLKADHILLLGLLVAFVAGSILLYIPGGTLPNDHSAQRANPAGCKGLFEALERTGCPVQTWRRPLTELPPDADVLCLIDPTTWPLRDEVETIFAWVRAGNTLILTPQIARQTFGPPGTMEYERDLLAELGVELQETGPEESVTRVDPGTRLAAKVAQIEVRGKLRVDDSERHYDVIVADESGPVVVRLEKGDGAIYVVTCPDLFSNDLVARQDNVVFLANLLWSGLRRGQVYFDEYHHGFREARPVWQLLTAERGGWAVLHLLAAAALFFFGRAWRFGAPVSLIVRKRRSALEHIQAFAALYRQARAANAAMALIVEGFRRRLAGRLGLPWNTPAHELANLAARDRPEMRQPLQGLIEGADRAAIDTTLGEAELQYLAAQLAQQERTLE